MKRGHIAVSVLLSSLILVVPEFGVYISVQDDYLYTIYTMDPHGSVHVAQHIW